MADNITTFQDISPRGQGIAKGKLLKRYQHLAVTERFGYVDPQPRKMGDQRVWGRYQDLPRATAPLAEAVSGPGQKLRRVDYTATLELFGDSVNLTKKVKDLHEDPVGQEATDLCGEQARETIEVIRINVLKAGTNVFYANGVASRALVNSPPTRGDFRRIVRAFKRAKAQKISKIIAATQNISTQPVEEAYFAMGHTDLDSDIRGISGFLPVAQYANSGKALPGEVGSIEECRIILTPLFEPWEAAGVAGTAYLSSGAAVSAATACDVYPLIFVAKDAYGIVPLQGKNSIEMGMINPGTPTKDDQHGLRGFVSWCSWQACARLNESWIARLECAATANPS
jgi:N4-gp56 family major capsid protein